MPKTNCRLQKMEFRRNRRNKLNRDEFLLMQISQVNLTRFESVIISKICVLPFIYRPCLICV